MSLTTHVLDTARGRPAAGLRVTVEARASDGWLAVGGGVTDADGRVPGLVADGALAAAAGGITTLVDMPLNSIPPTADVAALEAKREAADGQLHVDVAF